VARATPDMETRACEHPPPKQEAVEQSEDDDELPEASYPTFNSDWAY
jgi:hypothetical protein